MIAYHNDPQIKAAILAQIRAHAEADEQNIFEKAYTAPKRAQKGAHTDDDSHVG